MSSMRAENEFNANAAGNADGAEQEKQAESAVKIAVKSVVNERYSLFLGDCLDIMKGIDDNSVDAVVCDPPYALTSDRNYAGKGFMGKAWDNGLIAFNTPVWKECLRILKPGGHLLAFGGSRTFHRLACAVEDAGFEYRDTVTWLFGSGFPKNHDIAKKIDQMAGAERELVGSEKLKGISQKKKENASSMFLPREWNITSPATDLAKQWEGWGTALKPAAEMIVFARKPLSEKTVAENVLKWGTGGINIDGCRILADLENERRRDLEPSGKKVYDVNGFFMGDGKSKKTVLSGIFTNTGRWPANLILEDCDCVKAGFPESNENGYRENPAKDYEGEGCSFGKTFKAIRTAGRGFNDTGSAARYFKQVSFSPDDYMPFYYSGKASKRDRDEGLEGFELHDGMNFGGELSGNGKRLKLEKRCNGHPCVKPTELMAYLCRLITPKNGIVLDPFMGSGSTGKAAMREGFIFWGIEKEEEYFRIANARIEHACCKGEIFRALSN